MPALVELVPNFSEGRDQKKIDAIIEAILAGPGVFLLDRHMDADHNRSVITLAGERDSIGEAALRGIGRATELIDLCRHQGVHPRLGSTDVVPFVPIEGVSLEDCVHIAERVGEETWQRFRIPVYLYEAAARRPERKNLENIRRGQFERLSEVIAHDPSFRPDFGEPRLHPTAGATAVVARKFLIAFNVNLGTSDVSLAESVARKIRASNGGLPAVKAIGVKLETRNLVQVSTNLTDYETTSVETVLNAIEEEAAAAGVQLAGSEIVGLIPRRALPTNPVRRLRLENFHPDLILENRLAQAIAGSHPGSVPIPTARPKWP